MGMIQRFKDNASFSWHRKRIEKALEEMQKHQFDRHPFVYETWEKKARESWEKISGLKLRKTNRKD